MFVSVHVYMISGDLHMSSADIQMFFFLFLLHLRVTNGVCFVFPFYQVP